MYSAVAAGGERVSSSVQRAFLRRDDVIDTHCKWRLEDLKRNAFFVTLKKTFNGPGAIATAVD